MVSIWDDRLRMAANSTDSGGFGVLHAGHFRFARTYSKRSQNKRIEDNLISAIKVQCEYAMRNSSPVVIRDSIDLLTLFNWL